MGGGGGGGRFCSGGVDEPAVRVHHEQHVFPRQLRHGVVDAAAAAAAALVVAVAVAVFQFCSLREGGAGGVGRGDGGWRGTGTRQMERDAWGDGAADRTAPGKPQPLRAVAVESIRCGVRARAGLEPAAPQSTLRAIAAV